MQKCTPAQAKQWLKNQNITAAQWARDHGFNSADVSRVLNGKTKAVRGMAREIAIKLNIQLDGE
jgi:putative phage-related DNA-binding protein|nr:MAG TPA: hypothetical protein [Caudoviricetes sp.]DAK77743.1 MAG TPA: hypothetical protein [Caudoviricetes sp.]DAX52867.1 MAG TPA: hypothetical protein [Caudoviricetes sp.]